MLPSANTIWGNLLFQFSETKFCAHLPKFSEATHQKKKYQVLKPFFIVLCYLHLYIETQLVEKFSGSGVKNGPFFQTPRLHVEQHHHQNPHILRHRRASTGGTGPKPPNFLQCEIDVASGVTLTWLVAASGVTHFCGKGG